MDLNSTDIHYLREQFSEICSREAALDLELDHLISSESEIYAFHSLLQSIPNDFEALDHQSFKLHSAVADTNKLAQKISKKVRLLNSEQLQVRKCLEYVDSIQELKICVQGLEKSLDSSEIQDSAGFFKRIAQIKHMNEISQILHGSADSALLDTLESLKMRLLHLLVCEFQDAVAGGKDAHAKQVISLFPLIGQESLGIEKFSGFLCSACAKYSSDFANQVAEGKLSHADAISRVFEMIATVITKQEWISIEFGQSFLLGLIKDLAKESDVQTSILVQSFIETCKLGKILYDVTRNPDAVDLKNLDGILNEIALISHKTVYFSRFIRVKSGDSTEFQSKVEHQIQELMNEYLKLEEFYIKKTLEKAIQLDRREQNQKISTSIDDAFFCFKKIANRAISTANAQCLCAVLNIVTRLLDYELMNDLQRKLSACFTADNLKKQDYFWLMNNIESCSKYLEILCNETMQQINETDKGVLSQSVDLIKATMNSLQDYKITFNASLKEWSSNIFSQLVKPKAQKTISDAFKDLKFTATEQEYRDPENAVFSKSLMTSFNRIMSAYKKHFTVGNSFLLLLQLLEFTVKEVERKVFLGKFTIYGAFQFEREVRSLSHYFIEQTPPQHLLLVKEKFIRLDLFTSLLAVQDLEEVQDIWEAQFKGSISVGAALVKKVLALRLELDPNEIYELTLD